MCSDQGEDRDLRDVNAEERSRGSKRKPIDSEERRRAKQLREDILQGYRTGDEMGFRIALLAAGWPESSPEFGAALRKFREAVRKRPTR